MARKMSASAAEGVGTQALVAADATYSLEEFYPAHMIDHLVEERRR